MAESYAHKWGQMIGNLFQDSLREGLQEVADRHGLYLDYLRDRPARTGKKVSWTDRNGNVHDLDYVLERGGTNAVKGLPAAFIETAWRRYTKHSRNKAQEIQGAVLALADTFNHLRPFLGTVLAGVFTQGSLDQLRSSGFSIAYIPYDVIVRAFAAVRIDASFGEDTEEAELREKVQKYGRLTAAQLKKVKSALMDPARVTAGGGLPMTQFLAALDASLSRGVSGVMVAVLHGQPRQVATAQEAIDYLQSYPDAAGCAAPASKYEVHVRYNNGDVIDGIFQRKDEAIKFLRSFA